MSVKKPPQVRKLSSSPVSLSREDTKDKDKDKKKKLVVACMACRAKKVKCSSDKPACRNCLRLNVPCEYPLIRNRGSRFGYSGYMEKRLTSLEKCLLTADAQRGLTSTISLIPTFDAGNTSFDGKSAPTPVSQASPRGASNTYAESNASDESTLTIKLPSPELTDYFVDLYFKHIHNHTYSYLYRPLFEEKVRNGTVNKALVYAVCGLCCRFANHPKIEPGAKDYLGAQYITQARKLIRSQLEDPDIETVQASICVVQYEFFLANGSKSMIYIGLAIRMASHLSLFKELEGPELAATTWQERELRRRTWWSIVVLDRLAHGTNWTLLIPAEHFEVQLPSSRENFELDQQQRTVFLDGKGSDIPFDEDAKQAPVHKFEHNVFSLHILVVEAWSRVTKYANDGALRKSAKKAHLKKTQASIKSEGSDGDGSSATTSGEEQALPWELGSDFQVLAATIRDIQTKIPDYLQFSPENLQEAAAMGIHGMFVHVHCVLQQTICTLYQTVYPLNTSLYTRQQLETVPRTFLETAAVNIVNSASVISSVAMELLQHNMVPAPFVGFCVFSTSPVHIANTFSKDALTSSQAQHNLATNLKLLIHLKDYWQVVSMWCSTIRERYSEKLRQVEAAASKQNPDKIESTTGTPLVYNHHYTPTNAKHKSGEIDKRKVAMAAMRKKEMKEVTCKEEAAIQGSQEMQPTTDQFATWTAATSELEQQQQQQQQQREKQVLTSSTPVTIPSTPVLMSVFTDVRSDLGSARNVSFALPQAMQSVSKPSTPLHSSHASPRSTADENHDLNMLKNILYPSFSNPPMHFGGEMDHGHQQESVPSPRNWDLFPELSQTTPQEYGFHDLGEQWLRHFEIGVDDIQRVFPKAEGYDNSMMNYLPIVPPNPETIPDEAMM